MIGYITTKSAVIMMAEQLALDLAKYKIRVNALCPGWIDTPGERKFFTEEQIEAGGKQLPFGRLGQPNEVAKAIAYVLSDDAAYMTGSTLSIDGGVSQPWWSNRTGGEL